MTDGAAIDVAYRAYAHAATDSLMIPVDVVVVKDVHCRYLCHNHL